MNFFLFFFFLLVSTQIDRLALDIRLEGLSYYLLESHHSLQDNLHLRSSFSTCNFNDLCSEYSNEYSNEYSFTSDPVYGHLSISMNETSVKFSRVVETQTPALQKLLMEQVCFVNSQQQTIWMLNSQHSRRNDTHVSSAILWQYFIGETSGTTIFHPAFKRSETSETDVCSYNPKERPWYGSAISSVQKNLILLIDLSDTLSDGGYQMTRMKQSAQVALDSLSYRDFVGLVTYKEFSQSFLPILMRASNENLEQLKEYIKSLETSLNSEANIGEAIEYAYQMLISSRSKGISSKCNNTIFMILSTGANDFNTNKPLDVVLKYQILFESPLIFAYIYESNQSNQSRNGNSGFSILDLTEITCHTNGNLFMIESNSSTVDMIQSTMQNLNDYGDKHQYVRWSEPYLDVLTGQSIITASLPIYVNTSAGKRVVYGVLAQDTSLMDLGLDVANVTEESNFLDYLLSRQFCVRLNADQPKRTCDQNGRHISSENEKSHLGQQKGGLIVASIALAGFFILLPISIWYCCVQTQTDNRSFITGCLFTNSVTMIICSIWALSVFWTAFFPQIVKYHEWQSTTFRTERIPLNPYRCCQIAHCRDCTNYNGESCNSLLHSLKEGACQIGYHCCSEFCQTCMCSPLCKMNPDGTTSCVEWCNTCCACTSAVENRRCDVFCGTCWNPVTTKSYLDQSNAIFYVSDSGHCGLNETQCLASFVESHGPIGKEARGFYNPYNKKEVTTSITYDRAVMAAFLIPVCIIGFMFVMLCYVTVLNIKYLNINKSSRIVAPNTILRS